MKQQLDTLLPYWHKKLTQLTDEVIEVPPEKTAGESYPATAMIQP